MNVRALILNLTRAQARATFHALMLDPARPLDQSLLRWMYSDTVERFGIAIYRTPWGFHSK